MCYIRLLAISILFAFPLEAAIRMDADADSLERTTNLPSSDQQNYTMMGWFYMSVDRDAFSLQMQYGAVDGDDDVEMNTDSDGTTTGIWDGGSFDTGAELTVATWFHRAVSVISGAGIDYLNGESNITGFGPDTTTANELDVIDDANDSDDVWWNGRGACIKIYSVGLTQAQIQNEMRRCRPVRTSNLNSWHPMVRTSAATAALDYSGNGNDITVGGTPTIEDGPPVGW